MPPKRFTAEEKAEALVFELIRSDDFLSIKELEKLGPKRGIQQQMVKEIADSLVDDGRVEREKIGSANYYWSFASQASNIVQSAHDKSAATCAEAEARLRVIETTIRVGREQRTPSSSRDQQLQSLSKTEQEIASLKNELEQQHATDPATVKRNLDLLEVARSSAVGHTENIAILVKFAQQWLQVERDAVCHFLDLPSDWEELEELPPILSAALARALR